SFHVNMEDRSMVISGKLPEGAKIRFSLPPDFDVIEEVIEQNKKFRETQMPEADALIIYNCGGRLLCFGPLISEEIKGMKEVWNVPMAGMFSNAEIGRTPGGNLEMHNLTTCYVVLKEK
ncbi:MAG: FIST C-terminal domain-containing protein, partial [Ginsengibacter sp.]